MDKKYVVYQHVTPDGMYYFGQTKDVEKRWESNGAKYKKTSLQPYIEKFGWDNIQHIVLFKDQTKENALWIEDFLITTAQEDGVCINKKRSGLVSKEEGYSQEYYEINKEQVQERQKQYYEQNKDKIREYYEQNKDKIKEQSKQYREQNKDKIKEQSKQYREQNREKYNEYHRQYQREYNEKNRDKILEYQREYQRKNKDKINEYQREYYQRKKLEKQLKESQTTTLF